MPSPATDRSGPSCFWPSSGRGRRSVPSPQDLGVNLAIIGNTIDPRLASMILSAILKHGLRRKTCMVCRHPGGLMWDVTLADFPRRVELCGNCCLWSEQYEGRSYARRLPRTAKVPRMAPTPAARAFLDPPAAGAVAAVAVAVARKTLRRDRAEAVQQARQGPMASRREIATAYINSRQRRTSRRPRNVTT